MKNEGPHDLDDNSYTRRVGPSGDIKNSKPEIRRATGIYPYNQGDKKTELKCRKCGEKISATPDSTTSNGYGEFSFYKFEDLFCPKCRTSGGNKMPDIGKPIALKEQHRIYHFPGGDKVYLCNVIELVVRESGTHRIKTKEADGRIKLHIIPTGWIHIEISGAEDWTV